MFRRISARRVLLIGLTAFIALPLIAFVILWLTLPSVSDLHARAQTPSTKILDRAGRLLYEIADPRTGHNTPLTLGQIPQTCQQATIAVEDANFYTNPGVDLIGIARALWINLKGGEALAGGSTITQQLARILLLDPQERQQRTLLRKARESLLAWQMTQRYSKQEILALYFNEIYYGNVAYGLEAASRAYFGKSANELDLAECALLAGLPQSPATYDPYTDPELAQKRQTIVLGLMTRNAFITEEQAIIARRVKLGYAPAPYNIRAPHFVNYARRWLEEQFGDERVVRGGLIVTTTLDLSLNDAATAIMRERLAQLSEPNDGQPTPDHNANNAALVAIDPQTGEILTMVGSPNYFDAKISGAVNASTSLRQPGSAIKPITYAAAFTQVPGFTAATPLFDVRTAFPTREGLPYVPVNYDRQHHGPVSVRAALATSNNVAAVSVLQQVGLDAMLTQANAMGLHSFKDVKDYGLSLTLGGGEVRLLELATAYAVFANAGNPVEPFAIVEVRTSSGELLMRHSTLGTRRGFRADSILDPRIAWLLSDILSDNTARAPAFGEGSVLKLSRPAAVKTGTTTDYRDNWTVGYTPDLVTGVWVGNADGKPMQNISGVTGAGPIWHDFMEAALRGKPTTWFARPTGLRSAQVCALSGLLPTPDCLQTQAEWFIEGTEPTTLDTWHVGTQLNLPVALRQWAREQGWPLVRDEGRGMRDEGDSPLVITQPDDGTLFRISKALPRSVQRIALGVAVNERDVTRVEIMLNTGEVIASFTQAPFSGIWPMRPGQFTLTARATLRNGQIISSPSIRINVLE